MKVEIPVGARLTFGPTAPYAGKNGYGAGCGDYSLRVYTSSKNDSLVAVFAGVVSFRDITIPVSKLIIREAGKSIWKSDETGYAVENEVKYDKSWENLQLTEGK